MSQILGIHHVTAIASDPQRNLDFYAGVLGLRLVKRTVNFDDPQTYHFYYGDEVGTPGSILTFFPWPGARRGRRGSGQVAVTAFSIPLGGVGFWVERLLRHDVRYDGPSRRGTGADAEQVIAFEDPDGLYLELVAHPAAAGRPAWSGAPGIPARHALRGLHGVTLWVDDSARTERVLADAFGFRALPTAGAARRYTVGAGGPGTFVDLAPVTEFGVGTGGAGTVHHVAFAVADDAAELAVRQRVAEARLHPTPVIDRTYFRSVYIREPGGVLFEIATNPPGFAIDEPVAHLGERLMLPPQNEAQRAEIEALLPRIHLPVPPSSTPAFAAAGGPEDVSGDEDDLLPLGRALLPGAGMLSPRGKVRERGAPRFFRRLAEGVFDQEDLARRTDELADFVAAAAATYQLARDGVIAVGFSNGANVAASVLLRRPGVLRAAVLLSPMVPFEPDAVPDLRGTAVFIGAGRTDPIAPAAQAERLAGLLQRAGAAVTLHWTDGGHAISAGEVEAARHWIEHYVTGSPPGGA